ncbi:helix-turn-helix domain-containing protein [Thalassobellus citreus]|uniref:helix-turn-helix domain-containing protein n=1 Tax=Thalassobellus citreus TaxID=3367752 RepID=UPI0037A7AA0C
MTPKVFEYKKLTYQDKTVFSKIVMGAFDRIEKYFQKNEACFMFVNNGDMILRTPEQTIHIKDGDGLFAKCGNYFFEKQSSEKITLIAAYFYPEILKQIFSTDILSSDFTTKYDAKKVVIDKLLSDFKDNISYLLENPNVVDDTYLLTKLKEFIILLSKSENAPSVISFVASFYKPHEYDFKSIIEKNKFSDLSLNELATLCNMSLASFKRKFKEFYNTTPKQYLVTEKIKKASQLLKIKEKRIVEVAYDCGFESITAFNRNFKKITNQTPTEYRNN